MRDYMPASEMVTRPAAGRNAAQRVRLRVVVFEGQTGRVEKSLGMLRAAGFEVTEDVAGTRAELQERVKSRSCDVILSGDPAVQAAGMEGFEVVHIDGAEMPFLVPAGSPVGPWD